MDEERNLENQLIVLVYECYVFVCFEDASNGNCAKKQNKMKYCTVLPIFSRNKTTYTNRGTKLSFDKDVEMGTI